jgi:fructose-bisphosphate aldolase class II
MSLVLMMKLLRAARQGEYAIGAFNCITAECGEAIVNAAELVEAPSSSS